MGGERGLCRELRHVGERVPTLWLTTASTTLRRHSPFALAAEAGGLLFAPQPVPYAHNLAASPARAGGHRVRPPGHSAPADLSARLADELCHGRHGRGPTRPSVESIVEVPQFASLLRLQGDRTAKCRSPIAKLWVLPTRFRVLTWTRSGRFGSLGSPDPSRFQQRARITAFGPVHFLVPPGTYPIRRKRRIAVPMRKRDARDPEGPPTGPAGTGLGIGPPDDAGDEVAFAGAAAVGGGAYASEQLVAQHQPVGSLGCFTVDPSTISRSVPQTPSSTGSTSRSPGPGCGSGNSLSFAPALSPGTTVIARTGRVVPSCSSDCPGAPWCGWSSARCSRTGSGRSRCRSRRRCSGSPTSSSRRRSRRSRTPDWASPTASTRSGGRVARVRLVPRARDEGTRARGDVNSELEVAPDGFTDR